MARMDLPLNNFTSRAKKYLGFFKNFYVLIILLIIYIPLIVVLLLSFTGQTNRGNIVLNFNSLSFNNWKILFTNDAFLDSLLNSLIISAVVVPVSVFIGVITCFGIWNTTKKKELAVIGISKLSIAIPEPITAISLALLFSSTWVAMGLNFGLITICLSHISFCTPYAIVAIYPKMQKMNKNLVMASYDLGYSKVKTFLNIVIPYLLPAILSAAAITFAMSLDDFIITNLINGSTQTISTAIYTTRKGIKAWVVTFGGFLIIITAFITLIAALRKIRQNKTIKKLKTARHYENSTQ